MRVTEPELSSNDSDCEAQVNPAAAESGHELRYWFGPKKLATVRLRVQTEDCWLSLFHGEMTDEPNLVNLPRGVLGIYRQCEPVSVGHSELNTSRGMIRYVETSSHRRYIDLSMEFETYLAKFSTKSRSTLLRKVRKFREASGGTIDWRIYRNENEIDDFHELARKISEKTYQEKLFEAGIPKDRQFIFHMRSLAKNESVFSYVLFLHGEPISYLYCPVEDDRVIYGYLGFDPRYAKHSPGMVLHFLAIEHLLSEKHNGIFDFTEGDNEHKRFLSTSYRPYSNVLYLKFGIRSLAIVYSHYLVRRVSDFSDSWIERVGLKAYLRRHIRGQH